jgi:aminoglycoside N3'-acetyltransferase
MSRGTDRAAHDRADCGRDVVANARGAGQRGRQGQVLLLGVGHQADTTLHLVEILGGAPYRVPKHCTVLRDGCTIRIDYGENDLCGARFALADDWLRARGMQREGVVGHAHARLVRARDVVSVALEHLARDPLVFLHPPGANCAECDEVRALGWE